MKKYLLIVFIGITLISCTETESEFDDIQDQQMVTQLTLSASQTNITAGNSVTFQVISNLNTNLTTSSVFSVNNDPIVGNNYTFPSSGIYMIRAIYENIISDVVQINVVENSNSTTFVSRVLVEEYSGTWCGNCPRILYGTELLKQQTDKAVTVQIHLFNGDPFITPRGNAIATSLGINGVPSGRINRTIVWNGPQYQNVNQVINEIGSSSEAGLAINSSIISGALNVNITMGFSNQNNTARLVVYVVEDNLRHTQANYSSNLYNGLSSIPNFRYDGVFRAEITPPNGELIQTTNNQTQRSYTATVTNIATVSNAKVVAFLINNSTNKVINVREAVIGQSQQLEFLD